MSSSEKEIVRWEYCEKIDPVLSDINELGEYGWELVVVVKEYLGNTFYFKRIKK